MRIEQLVLYGPGDDDRVKFGPGITVFAGLGTQERADLIETVADSLTGQLPNASIVYTDEHGHRIFADRTGATDAETGKPARPPSAVLGRDTEALIGLLRLDADDLGLGERVSPEKLHAELTAARAELDELLAEHGELLERTELIATWRNDLGNLDQRIDRADEDAARWTWVGMRRRLDELQAELNMVDQAHHGRSDDQILQAVDALRSAGEGWAELAAQAEAMREQLGELPDVRPGDLARVADTPAELPTGFEARLEAWQAATDLRRSVDAELALVDQPVAEPSDPLVATLAAFDQDRLWALHRELGRAVECYDEQSAVMHRSEVDTDTEQRIEEAHLEVVRCQREVERRFRPGVLASAALAVGALLAGQSVSVIVAAPMLLGAVAMGGWLLALPRRNLAAATIAEESALAHADAGSWLGLHLRRLDTMADATERKRFQGAADARASAQLDWDDLAGPHSADELSTRADEVRAYAEATDPKVLTRRREEAHAFSEAAREAERTARISLTNGLDAYGLARGGTADLDPRQLTTILTRRIQAGTLARRVRDLRHVEQRETDAAHQLDLVLTHLGYGDGDLDARLERAIAAVSAARQRRAHGSPPRAHLEAEVAELGRIVAAGARRGWADEAEPGSAPTDPNLLEARRREISELIAAAGSPDVVGAQRRVDVAQGRVGDLEQRLEDLAQGPESVQHRLMARCGRTTRIDDHEESIPVVMDEALVSVPVGERMDILDLMIRLAEHVQIVVLTEDPVVARWARQRSDHARVTLYEAAPEPAATPHAVVAEPIPFSAQLPVSLS